MASEKIEKTVDHPLEEMFGIEPGTTTVPAVKRESELAVATEYDDKDNEVDEQFQEVYDIALEAYEQQAQEAELVEGKYRARNHEIAAQYLNTALNAAANKATLKTNKDKLRLGAAKLAQANRGGAPESKDGLVVGTTGEILRAMREAKKAAEADDGVVSEQ